MSIEDKNETSVGDASGESVERRGGESVGGHPVMRDHLMAVVTIAVVAGWFALAGGQQSKPTTSSLVPVRVGLVQPATDFVPVFIAKEKGFYAEEGLDVEIVFMGPSQAVTATINGDLQFNANLGTTLRAAFRGAPARAILSLNRGPGFWLFSKPEIRSVGELAGQTVATGPAGSSPHTFMLFILGKFGLAGKVNVLPLASGEVAALTSGKVAASYANSDGYIHAQDAGFRKLLSFLDHIEQPTSGIGTSVEMITNKPALVQGFVNATFRAMMFFKHNKSESVKLLARYQKRDENSAQRVYALDVDNFGGDGTVKCEAVKRQFELERGFLRLDVPPPCDLLVNNQFTQKIPTRWRSGQ